MVLIVLAAIGSIYFGWALHRASDQVFSTDMDWPRPWPFPDQWLADLNHHYDVRHPVTGDMIKLHGELDHVRLAVGTGVTACLWVLIVGVGLRTGNRPDGGM